MEPGAGGIGKLLYFLLNFEVKLCKYSEVGFEHVTVRIRRTVPFLKFLFYVCS
jgi:hypothetical protein